MSPVSPGTRDVSLMSPCHLVIRFSHAASAREKINILTALSLWLGYVQKFKKFVKAKGLDVLSVRPLSVTTAMAPFKSGFFSLPVETALRLRRYRNR